MSGDAPHPALLPALDLPVQVLREERRLRLGSGELVLGPVRPGDPRPRVARWTVQGGLMPDEMVLIFGRPLDWTGPVCDQDPGLPLVENCLGGPFILTRKKLVICSPEPELPEPLPHVTRFGWCYGAVLLRGEDSPWYAQSMLTLNRTTRIG